MQEAGGLHDALQLLLHLPDHFQSAGPRLQPLSELLPSTCSSSPTPAHLSFLLALGSLRTLEPLSWESASLSAPPLTSSRTPPTLEDPTFQPGLCTFSVPQGPVSQSPF